MATYSQTKTLIEESKSLFEELKEESNTSCPLVLNGVLDLHVPFSFEVSVDAPLLSILIWYLGFEIVN